MKKIFFALLLTTSLFIIFSSSSRASLITVCPSGCDNTTIQDAINAASYGDEVRITDNSTEYLESVLVNQSILLDSNVSLPLIRTNGTRPTIIITSNNVTISGFLIKYNGTTANVPAIEADSVNNVSIFNNTVDAFGNSSNGINLGSANQSEVSYNTIETNGENSSNNIGINLTGAMNDSLKFNRIFTNGSSNNQGIWINDSSNNTIQGNNISTDGTFTTNSGIYLSKSDKNVIIFNNVFTHGSDTSIGIWLISSSNNTISNNNITTNSFPTPTVPNNYGIEEDSTTSNLISFNNISTNGFGAGGTTYNTGIFINGNNTIFLNNSISTSGSDSNWGVDFASSAYFNKLYNSSITTNGSLTNYAIDLYSQFNTFDAISISTGGDANNFGIFIGPNADNNLFTNSEINTTGNTSHAIVIDNTTNNTFIGMAMNPGDVSSSPVFLEGTVTGNDNYIIDSTFDRIDVNVSSPDVATKLFIQHHVNAVVKDTTGSAISTAHVTARHANLNYMGEDPIFGNFSSGTNTSGYITEQVLSEYIVNGSYNLTGGLNVSSYNFISNAAGFYSFNLVRSITSPNTIAITLTTIPGGGGGGGGSGTNPVLSWTNVPSDIVVNQTLTNQTCAILNNTGNGNATSVSISARISPSGNVSDQYYQQILNSFIIQPGFVPTLAAGSFANVCFNETIPANATVGDYKFQINASDTVTSYKNFTITVIPFVVNQTEAQAAYDDANSTIQQAIAAGKNVTRAQADLATAKQFLDAGNYTSAKAYADLAKNEALNASQNAPSTFDFTQSFNNLVQWLKDHILIAGATIAGVLIIIFSVIASKRRGSKSFSDLRTKLDTLKKEATMDKEY